MASSVSLQTRCPACTEEGRLTCAGCKNVKYCCLECQQSDWQFHKSLCKSYNSFSPHHRPGDDMRRVIFFPADGKKPEFRWLPVWNIPDEYQPEQEVQYQSLLGTKALGERHYIKQNRLINANLGSRQINLVFDDMFFQKYPKPNLAAKAATNGKAGFDWRGPMVAYCGETPEFDEEEDWTGFHRMAKAGDMEMRDFSDLVSFLIYYGREQECEKMRRGGKVLGMKMNCEGERQEYGAPWAQVVRVPRLHPVFEGGGEICGTSKLVDMPLLLRKYPEKRYPITNGNQDNLLVTWMQLRVDPHDEWFGWAKDWMGGQVPNVLVVRADRKPLSEDVLLAFGNFCSNHIQQQLEAALESGSQRRKQAAIDWITPMRWGMYLKGTLESLAAEPSISRANSSDSASS